MAHIEIEPICPQCRSRAVVPSPHDAGSNECRNCLYVGPVREFHPSKTDVLARALSHIKPERIAADPIARAAKTTVASANPRPMTPDERAAMDDQIRRRSKPDPEPKDEPSEQRQPRRQWWQDID